MRIFIKKICKGRLNPVLKTIEIAAKHTHVEITTLIIDGVNSSEEEIEALTNWIGNINREIPFHISKFFPPITKCKYHKPATIP